MNNIFSEYCEESCNQFWTFWNFLYLFAFILVSASSYLFVSIFRKFRIVLLSLLLLSVIPDLDNSFLRVIQMKLYLRTSGRCEHVRLQQPRFRTKEYKQFLCIFSLLIVSIFFGFSLLKEAHEHTSARCIQLAFFSRAAYGANRAVSESKTIGQWTSSSCYSTGVFLKASRGDKWLIPRG